MRKTIIQKLHELEEGKVIILTKAEQEYMVQDWLQTHTRKKVSKEQVIMEENADILVEED